LVTFGWLQEKQGKAPHQVEEAEETEDVNLGSREAVSMNPNTELQCRLEKKLNAIENSRMSAARYVPALRTRLSKIKQND
jgi:hypothetical protein